MDLNHSFCAIILQAVALWFTRPTLQIVFVMFVLNGKGIWNRTNLYSCPAVHFDFILTVLYLRWAANVGILNQSQWRRIFLSFARACIGQEYWLHLNTPGWEHKFYDYLIDSHPNKSEFSLLEISTYLISKLETKSLLLYDNLLNPLFRPGALWISGRNEN